MDLAITVVIPSLNRRDTILSAIQSVQEQSVSVFEIIVVDDGSSDDTQDVVLASSYSNIRLIRNEKNCGVAYSRNLGVSAAKTEWVAFLDSDDVYFVNRFSSQLTFLQKFPQFDAVCGRVSVISNRSNSYPDTQHPPSSVDLSKGLDIEQTLSGAIAAPSTWLIKKKVFQEIGGFDISLKKSEDRDLLIRLLANHSMGGPNEIIGINFKRDDGLTATVDPHSSYFLIKKHESIFKLRLTKNKIASMYSDCGIEFLRIGDVSTAFECCRAECELSPGLRQKLRKEYVKYLIKIIQTNSIPLRVFRKLSRLKIN